MDLYKVFLYCDDPAKGTATCMIRATTMQAANILGRAIANSMTQIDEDDDKWEHVCESS